MMPWQLKEGLRRRPRGKFPPRPICEKLPSVSANDLRIPRDSKRYIAPNISLRYTFLAGMRLTWDCVEFQLRSLHRGQLGQVQTFQIKPIKTGFGVRYAFVCDCGKGAIKLYHHRGELACKHCHGAINASQAISSAHRPALQASRIQSILDNARLYNRTREHLTKRFGHKVMMAQSLLK